MRPSSTRGRRGHTRSGVLRTSVPVCAANPHEGQSALSGADWARSSEPVEASLAPIVASVGPRALRDRRGSLSRTGEVDKAMAASFSCLATGDLTCAPDSAILPANPEIWNPGPTGKTVGDPGEQAGVDETRRLPGNRMGGEGKRVRLARLPPSDAERTVVRRPTDRASVRSRASAVAWLPPAARDS